MNTLDRAFRALALVIGAALALLTVDMAVAQTPLGRLSSNPYDPDSTSNPYGAGSPYEADGINNPQGAGNPFSSDSPTNPYGRGLIILGDDE